MTVKAFKAMLIEQTGEKTFKRSIVTRGLDDLPEGDVLIKVAYSSLNYKDGLSAIGNKGVTRNYPHTPGIDAAGEVVESRHTGFKPGDAVIVTSYDLGMNTAGGFGQYIRVPADWIVPLPAGLSPAASMAYGTAGLTAGMCVDRIRQHGVTPDRGAILVTGATGGVGSLAVAILATCGYEVAAVTGKAEAADFLGALGASTIISREEATDETPRPMLKGRWAGVVDTVGGNILETAIRSTDQHGAVTCCGLVASPQMAVTVFPFIIRGVCLYGIDSQNYPMADRRRIWQHLAEDWRPALLEEIIRDVSLDDLDPEIDAILKGKQKGRVRVVL
jgi:putative YhdH/YhfP family quinone oxidoreductase